jgi:hypothetical protein
MKEEWFPPPQTFLPGSAKMEVFFFLGETDEFSSAVGSTKTANGSGIEVMEY